MADRQIPAADGRTLSFADYGDPAQVPVFVCHGGPGSRLIADPMAQAARAAGLRLIGVDRPGYGKSTPRPGRSICDWTGDVLAIADHLELERFLIEGISTGGSYALATASVAPERVAGVLVCCGMTDMRWAQQVDEARMAGAAGIWAAPDRQAAIDMAVEQFGAQGEKRLQPDADAPPTLSPPDLALVSQPGFGAHDPHNEAFAQGAVGYADDRIADGPRHGWSSFDVSRVSCPVIVIHGEQDWIVPVAHAHHTASILTNAELRTYPEHGHLSVTGESVNALVDLRAMTSP